MVSLSILIRKCNSRRSILVVGFLAAEPCGNVSSSAPRPKISWIPAKVIFSGSIVELAGLFPKCMIGPSEIVGLSPNFDRDMLHLGVICQFVLVLGFQWRRSLVLFRENILWRGYVSNYALYLHDRVQMSCHLNLSDSGVDKGGPCYQSISFVWSLHLALSRSQRCSFLQPSAFEFCRCNPVSPMWTEVEPRAILLTFHWRKHGSLMRLNHRHVSCTIRRLLQV